MILDPALAALLTWLLKKVGNKVASEALTLAFNQVLGALGLKSQGKSDQDVLSALQGLATELQAVNSALTVVQAEIVEVQEQIDEQSYQMALATTYEPAKSTITTNFQSLANALAALDASDPTAQAQALATVQQLFGVTNANQVAEAMAQVNTFVAGDQSTGFAGLIPLQTALIQDSISNYWKNAGNLGNLNDPTLDPPKEAWRYSKNMRYEDFEALNPGTISFAEPGQSWCDNLRMFSETAALVLGPTVQNTVVPALEAILAVQAQGLVFLTMAWSGTVEQASLATPLTALKTQMGSIQALSDYFSAAGQVYDQFMQATLVSSGVQADAKTLDRMSAGSGNWKNDSAWCWINAANLPGASSPYAVIQPQPTIAAPQPVVYFTKAKVWGSMNRSPEYVSSVDVGWSWTPPISVSLPTALYASSFSASVLTPIFDDVLGWWQQLQAGGTTSPATRAAGGS